METINLSKCCRVEAQYVYDDKSDGYLCPKCNHFCEVEEVCADCQGTGEVTTMERVYAGEHHLAPIGSEVCRTCRPEPDYDDQGE